MLYCSTTAHVLAGIIWMLWMNHRCSGEVQADDDDEEEDEEVS